MKLKLNPFNVNVLVMHRWFSITAAERDLKVPIPIDPVRGVAPWCPVGNLQRSVCPPPLTGPRNSLPHSQYTPVIGFAEGWDDMCDWFIANWLPGFRSGTGRSFGLAKQSEDKIDIQAQSK